MSLSQRIMLCEDSVFGKGAEQYLIKKAENELGLSFCCEYIDYLSKLGAAMIDGHELTGISKVEHTNVVNVTMNERKLNAFVPRDYYVVEQTNIDGIVIWQNESGSIFQTVCGSPPFKIFDSMEEYLLAVQ